jgi:hypothetical protein
MSKIIVLVTLIPILILGTTFVQNSIAQNQTKSTCGIRLGGIIRTLSDQQQYCLGSADGQNAANGNFQKHGNFNSTPPPQTQGLNHTAAYDEGYKNSYSDEWNILTKG